MQLTKPQLRKTKLSRDEYINKPKFPIVLVLDQLASSFNIGSLIRLADSFAIEKVYICGNQLISDKKLNKTSRNINKWVHIEQCDNTLAVIKTLHASGYNTYAIELCNNSKNYRNITYSRKTAFVLGNETFGVSEGVLSLCHNFIHIQMHGMGNSMNVSSAGAIILADCINKTSDATS